MNVAEARVALRDRTLLDVLDLALRFVAAHARAYAKVSACVTVPGFFVSWLVWWRVAPWAGWAVALVAWSFARAPFVALASRLVFEDRVPARAALRQALGALPQLVAVRLLQAMAVVFGALFFVLPGVWMAVLFAFANEVVVLERADVSAALGRLQRLTAGWFGDVLMAELLGVALSFLAVVLGAFAGAAILEDLLQIKLAAGDTGLDGPLGLFGGWLAIPVLTTARFFVYLNLRTRREGWDIQTRFAALAARAAADTGDARRAA